MDMPSRGAPVDLTNCEREEIQFLGHVQPFGTLIAFTTDWIVTRASANVAEVYGVAAEELIGTPLDQLLGKPLNEALRRRMRMLIDPDAVERLFGLPIVEGGELFDFALHVAGGDFILEAERHGGGAPGEYAASVRAMVDRLSRATTVQELTDRAARQMKLLTGFDRVMVYRLSDDGEGHGTVIAEAGEAHMERFFGLAFPSTDIPKQARRMYLRSTLRIISDVDATPVPILPQQGPDGKALDLTMSATRAVSPIHLEYLRNMGVGASMSVSIIREGKLWGLFACHHESPRVLNYDVRSAAELFGQLFAFVLGEREAASQRDHDSVARDLHDRLMAQLAGGETLQDNFDTIAEALCDVSECDGMAAWIDGEYQTRGTVPSREEFEPLARFLNTAAASKIYTTDRLQEVYPAAASIEADVAGLLAIPVSRKPRDHIVCFRKEYAHTVTWSGNPDKPVEAGEGGGQLRPRNSFTEWKQEVRGRSRPWTPQQIRASEWLRITLLEVVLKMTDRAAGEAKQASERQELLIAELNHRVRNILTLIRGLISQSRSEGDNVEGFTAKIGGRVHALARAHDLITKKQWAPASLSELIRTEAAAYLSEKADRVRISGPDVLLKPQAFTTMSLVIHELLTNSAKYGGLADSRGSVEITLSRDEEEALIVNWQERGGPPVTAPTRRGFGTTIIERSVPFELKGEADIRYDVSGLRARFVIPGDQIDGMTRIAAKPAPAPQEEDMHPPLSGDVLLLEDNMIIAMDVENALERMGAERVHIAATVEEALKSLEKHQLRFAMLDVNLGSGTSEPVAEALTERKVPFLFSTGYGEGSDLTKRFANVGVLQKPVDEDQLQEALKKALG
ncbi:HWE histidine kinase domain-containing protein [Pacificimonas sp. ICDLI1SI03]